jgi:hypothetical protein
MKTIWVQVPILLGLMLFSRNGTAAQRSVQETVRLAQSLDELVDQQPSPGDQIFRNGQRLKKVVPPVPLTTITPVAAKILKMNENELRELLMKQEKLSHIVYARQLATKRNELWKKLLKTEKEFLVQLEKAGVPLSETYDQLELLHTELAFAALDAPLDPETKNTQSSSR